MATRTMFILTLGLVTVAVVEMCRMPHGKHIEPKVVFYLGYDMCMYFEDCTVHCLSLQRRELRSRQAPEMCKLHNGTEIQPGVDFMDGENSCSFDEDCNMGCVPPPPPPPPTPKQIKLFFLDTQAAYNALKTKALAANDDCDSVDNPGTKVKSGVVVDDCFWSAGCGTKNCYVSFSP